MTLMCIVIEKVFRFEAPVRKCQSKEQKHCEIKNSRIRREDCEHENNIREYEEDEKTRKLNWDLSPLKNELLR